MVDSQLFCELRWSEDCLAYSLCAPASVECGGQRTRGSCLFPHHLGPRSWAQGGRLGRKHYSSGWALVLAPIFILLFSNLIYHVDMVAHTIISASWEAEAGGWSWVKGFEAGLGSNIARLSWNKKSRPQVTGLCAWNPTVHCPNVALSTLPAATLVCPGRCPSVLEHLLWGWLLLLFLKQSFVISSVLSINSDTLFKEKKIL